MNKKYARVDNYIFIIIKPNIITVALFFKPREDSFNLAYFCLAHLELSVECILVYE
jgi:hypothetical protein